MCLSQAAAVLVNERVRKVPIVFFQQQGAPALRADGKALTDDYIPFRANPTGAHPSRHTPKIPQKSRRHRGAVLA